MESVSGLIQMALISPGVAIIRVLLTFAILFKINPRLALAAMVDLPPLGLTSFLWLPGYGRFIAPHRLTATPSTPA